MIRGSAHATVHLRTINPFLKLVYASFSPSFMIIVIYVIKENMLI